MDNEVERINRYISLTRRRLTIGSHTGAEAAALIAAQKPWTAIYFLYLPAKADGYTIIKIPDGTVLARVVSQKIQMVQFARE